MAGYQPLKITGPQTGLVQNRENFLLPDDAYPGLENAYVWRERIKRKKGFQLLGRLQRSITDFAGTLSAGGAGTVTFSIFAALSLSTSQPNAQIVPGTLIIGFGAPILSTLRDLDSNGTLTITNPGSGVITSATINYATGVVTFIFSGAAGASVVGIIMSYYPNLPVMGIRIEELLNSTNDKTIFFDQVYAYEFDSIAQQFKEFLPGPPATTWNASGAGIDGTDFFFSTNYWTGTNSSGAFTTAGKLFWVTNNTGGAITGVPDPIRVTDGTKWVDFVPPTYGQIDATNFLVQCLAFLPFRGRLVAFNTYEGPALAGSLHYSNRIRWSTIGNPFIPYAAGPPATGSWRDDIRGQGGFLDIPTSEDIVAVGFVRDNLVIYCERSTWQLRYTGRSIAPFQIERVNSELGAEGTFSAVQFDTSLVGIGDKGVVECDSYKSERIDVKIPDLVFQFNTLNNGVARVHGIRDFKQRLAFWTFPLAAGYDARISQSAQIFPNRRLVYNYENDSWALFTDTLTTIGTYQTQSSRTWLNTTASWLECSFSWTSQPQGDPQIVAGNQQGFIEYLDEFSVNDISLFIQAITANTTTPTVVTSPNHNLLTGSVINITGIPTGTPFDNLNNGIFGIIVIDENNFSLMVFDPNTGQFSTPQTDEPGSPYVGIGNISLRENFSIVSKKFNFLDEGQSIQIGYLDILMEASETDNPGAISLNVYLDYNDVEPSNTLPNNVINDGASTSTPDTFFNSVIPMTPSSLNGIGGTKFWQRVYCSTQASFLTLEYTFSNAQLAGPEQQQEVQIDAQVLWIRKGGRMTQI